MVRTVMRWNLFAAALFVGLSVALVNSETLAASKQCRDCGKQVCSHQHCANCRQEECVQCRAYGGNTPPNLFYNYYVPQQPCGGVPAKLYVAPVPTPPHVGHVWYTYQPLMPHEMLYPHHRSYHRYYDNGRGMTRTTVRWQRNHVKNFIQDTAHFFEFPR